MYGYHHFVQKQAMIQTLYGHSDSNERADYTVSSQEATQAVMERLEQRKEFSISYCGWLFYAKLMANCCQCFKRCCSQSSSFKSHLAKYQRFEIALLRLSEEHDIQRILSLNRISYLANKTKFNSRQRLAVNYSRKFVISDHDIRATRDKVAVIP